VTLPIEVQNEVIEASGSEMLGQRCVNRGGIGAGAALKPSYPAVRPANVEKRDIAYASPAIPAAAGAAVEIVSEADG
jgi:hypothetical protein